MYTLTLIKLQCEYSLNSTLYIIMTLQLHEVSIIMVSRVMQRIHCFPVATLYTRYSVVRTFFLSVIQYWRVREEVTHVMSLISRPLEATSVAMSIRTAPDFRSFKACSLSLCSLKHH